MNLFFCLFKYFPYGGLQRDFLKIARLCVERGHVVHVLTMSWEGEQPEGMQVTVLPAKGLSNHAKVSHFAKEAHALISASECDAVVGFNKMPGLDVYFAADPCYQRHVVENKSAWYRLLPRCKTYLAMESAVFEQTANTKILLLAPWEQQRFCQSYGTSSERFHLMPPGIAHRQETQGANETVRRQFRQHLNLADDEKMLLMVGSGFRTKGVDRAIHALAALPDELSAKCRLVVLGNGKEQPLQKLATRLGVGGRVSFHGVQDDVSSYYLAADLLVHPARTEAAGMVLLEAMTHGLPILVTDVCGYAFHIEQAGAGQLLSSPFCADAFSHLLQRMLCSEEMPRWKENGLDYAARTDLYSLPEKAVQVIEALPVERGANV
ncbi:MAG: glycosyltransferase family 4 protein [Desulfuromonadales bacterium]|nr:glycosyltransferase family 4 protein [Desulfuromonadales bacterium]